LTISVGFDFPMILSSSASTTGAYPVFSRVFKIAESGMAPGGRLTAVSLTVFLTPVRGVVSLREQESDISSPREIKSNDSQLRAKEIIPTARLTSTLL
jgi:hypothetical protein